MHIGIIIYSLGGNTISAAVQLEERLSAAGHDVMLMLSHPILETLQCGVIRPRIKDAVAHEPLDDQIVTNLKFELTQRPVEQVFHQ